MPRGITTLEQMVSDLRLETGRSSDNNIGQDEYATLKRILQRTQKDLYYDYDWPFLKVRRDILTQAGERYYDFDADIDPERLFTVKIKHGNIWLPVVRGITMDDYSIRDSDDDQNRSDPVEKWDIIDAGAGEQMELWPIPATNDLTVRMQGFKGLGAFVSDNAVCTLDNDLIVLFAAAKILAREKAEDAKEALAAAQKLYLNIRRGLNRDVQPTSLSTVTASDLHRNKGVIVIAPGGA